MLRNMSKKTYIKINTKYKRTDGPGKEPAIPEGLWCKCNKCGQPAYAEDTKNDHCVCPKYSGYSCVHAYHGIEMFVDEGTFEEWDEGMPSSNPLEFPGCKKKAPAAREKSRLNEAIVIGKGLTDGNPVVIGVYDARFIMNSMDHVMGEEITDVVEHAIKEKLPVVIFACPDGARMQEGIVSLMQMTKTPVALKRHHDAGRFPISALTDPTTDGVTAGPAMLGDIILVESRVLIGSAGPRIIEQTIGQKLPEGLQRSEFLLDHRFVDKIVEWEDQERMIGQVLYIHRGHKVNIQIPVNRNHAGVDKSMENSGDSGKTVWDIVLLPGRSDRLVTADYINAISDEFIEFYGDRYLSDDGAVAGGIVMFHGIPITVIDQQKGKNTEENLKRNFSMPSPGGYRKALHLMKQAETFGRSVICFVNTPEAFCGLEVKERGQDKIITRNLFEMSDLKVSALFVVIGGGGGGETLIMIVADEVWMLENTIHSILSPEGFASIPYKDSKKTSDVAKVMKVAAQDLKKLGLVERIISEEEPVCVGNLYRVAEFMGSVMVEFFESYPAMSGEELAEHRYQRLRRVQ